MIEAPTPGEIVYLNSGSPPLTVSDLKRGDGLITVEWFTGGEAKRSEFDPRCLTREAPPWMPPPTWLDLAIAS